MSGLLNKRLNHRYRYRLAGELGICASCGAGSERRRCDTCTARWRKPRPRQCKRCGIAIPPYKNYCAIHRRELDLQIGRARQAAYIRKGLCIRCKKSPAESGERACAPCAMTLRENSRNYYRKLRIQILAEYGGACVCCGETESDFLTFDHIDNNGGAHRRLVRAGSAFYKYVKKHRPTDIQILCANCNCAKGHYGICPHERARIGEAAGTRIRDNRNGIPRSYLQ